jgi:hypothetical protein
MTQPRPPSLMPVLDKPNPYIDSAKILEEGGNLALAEGLLAEAERQFPTQELVCMRRTEFIERHHGPEAALARWVLMSHRFPRQERIWAKLIRHHREAGRLQTAEAALTEGFANAGLSKLLYAEGALVARARNDLRASAQRWRTGVEHYPRWPEGIVAHNVTQSSLAAQELDMALEQGAPAPDTDHFFLPTCEPDADRLRELFMRFESLGNDSQFGFLQRYFGAGTLGLLKYAGISARNVARALDSDLAQIFDASDATLSPQPYDWHVRVPRAGLQISSLLEPTDPDALLARMRRRLRYLAMKLLEDLRDGQKTFVFKAFDLAESEISALHAAVRRHSVAPLLCVRAASGGRSSGSVEARDDGLWVGDIHPGGVTDRTFRDAWVAICKAVAEAVPTAIRPVD